MRDAASWRLPPRLGLMLLLALAACGRGAAHDSTPPAPAATPAATRPPLRFSPIVLLVLENQEEPKLIDSSAAPYLNALARDHTLLSQSYGVTHNSLPNYLALISGQTFGLHQDCNRCFQQAPTLVDQLDAVGRSWRAYFEDLPSPCGLGDHQLYAQHHNPFVYFAAVRLDAARCAAHIASFDQLAQDLAAGTLADFVWITPNLCHDLHNCSLSDGDGWLAQFLPTLLALPAFQPGGSGLLIVTTDEGTSNAGCCGDAAGGHIATIFVSPLLPPHSAIATPVSHYGILRLIEDNWGLAPLGHAAGAASGAQVLNAVQPAGP